MEHRFIEDHFDPNFQKLFKAYFNELGVKVENWNELFEEMNDCIKKYNLLTLLISYEEKVVGFIMFQKDELTNWFFKKSFGFIREFYIDTEYRGKGYGTILIEIALGWFKKEGIRKVILTSDTANQFYLKCGFKIDTSFEAKNELPTYVIEL